MKTEFIKFRVTEAEKLAFEQAAQMSGIALSAWVRERLRRAAIKDLTDAGRQVPFLQEIIEVPDK
jgi:hypothetical protein